MTDWYRVGAALVAFAAVAAGATNAGAQDFAARTVNIVIGFASGGGYDIYGRLLSRHLGRHLPGNPAVVAQNMPGGGSLNLANVTYNTAPADGSHIALVNSAAALEPVLGNAQARFETNRFAWIGNMNNDSVGCAAWVPSGITTWAGAVARKARFGGVGAAGTSSQHAYFLQHMLDAPIQVITGYRGTSEINLALQRGEAEASCGMTTSTMRGTYRADYDAGRLVMIIQFGKQDEPFFRRAVNVYSFIKREEDRQLTEFIFGQVEVSRPVIAPPATPAPVVAALRKAFEATMRDREFLDDAERGRIDLHWMSGAETAALMARFAAVPKPLAERAKVVLQPR